MTNLCTAYALQDPPSLTYYVPFLELSMHYYGLKNEQQFLQPLGNGS
jgi:hypothetical protein